MALIDKDIFVGSINIPSTDVAGVVQRLNLFIDEYEDKLLLDLFGYELKKAFDSGTGMYNPDGSNSTIDDKWMNLIDGAEYTKSNKLRKFNGLTKMVANFVYWHWMNHTDTFTTPLGQVKPKAENAQEANPAVQMVEAWNKLSESVEDMYHYLQENVVTYPEWDKHPSKGRMLNNYSEQNLWGF